MFVFSASNNITRNEAEFTKLYCLNQTDTGTVIGYFDMSSISSNYRDRLCGSRLHVLCLENSWFSNELTLVKPVCGMCLYLS